MKSAIEQSIKEKIKALAKERETTFAELWRNLILERFLTRLAKSSYKEKFILKGGIIMNSGPTFTERMHQNFPTSILTALETRGFCEQNVTYTKQNLRNSTQKKSILLEHIPSVPISITIYTESLIEEKKSWVTLRSKKFHFVNRELPPFYIGKSLGPRYEYLQRRSKQATALAVEEIRKHISLMSPFDPSRTKKLTFYR